MAHPVATSQAVQSPSSGKEIGTRFPAGFALPSCSDAFATRAVYYSFRSLSEKSRSLARIFVVIVPPLIIVTCAPATLCEASIVFTASLCVIPSVCDSVRLSLLAKTEKLLKKH